MAFFRKGVDVAGDLTDEAERKGEKGGCLEMVFGFIIGACFRLPFALIMIPIQAVFGVAQKKAEVK